MNEPKPEIDGLLPLKKKGLPRLVSATKYSLDGLRAAFQHEEAFRLELLLFCILAPIGFLLGQSAVERTLLVGCLFIVLLVELLNSAIEAIVDRAGTEFSTLAGRAKDIGSAAVFVSLMLVVFVWSVLLL